MSMMCTRICVTGGSSLTDSALGLLFARLDETEQPILLHSEFALCPSGVATLLEARLLKRTRDIDEVQHRDGRWMTVVRTDDRLFGVAMEEDDFFDPVPLTDEDVRAYEINLSGIVKALCDNNGLAGSTVQLGTPPAYLGRKEIPAWGTLDVYFAWANADEREFAILCRELRPSEGANHVGLLVPTPVTITSSLQVIMERNGVLPIPLSMHVAAPSLVVDWHVAIGAQAPAISPDATEDRLNVLVTRKFIRQCFAISEDTIRRYDNAGVAANGKPWQYIVDDSNKRRRRLYNLRMVFVALGPEMLNANLRQRGEMGLAQVLDKGEAEGNVFQIRSRPNGQMHR